MGSQKYDVARLCLAQWVPPVPLFAELIRHPPLLLQQVRLKTVVTVLTE